MRRPGLRVMTAVLGLAAALGLAACDTDKWLQSLYETGRNVCKQQSRNCSVDDSDPWRY